MTKHHIKCSPLYFQPMVDGDKRFEYRENDRDYKVGDMLVIEEYSIFTDKYTGRNIWFDITFIFQGDLGLPDGYCIMSLNQILPLRP